MRGNPGGLVLALALALAACAAPAPPIVPPAPPAGPRAERPAYQVGDRWIRSDGVYELTAIEADRYVFSAGPGREVRLTRDLVPARVSRGESLVELDPPPPLPWPLAVGQRGTAAGRWRASAADAGTPARFAWQVEAVEDVRVAAGTFTALRIGLAIEAAEPAPRGVAVAPVVPARRAITLWYAPEARQVVKAAAPDLPLLAFEILAVDRPEPAPLEVRIEAPPDGAQAAGPETTLVARVTGAAVSRAIVTVNGQEVARREAPAAGAPLALRLPVALRPGRNVILVTASDTSGATRQAARIVLHGPRDARTGPEGPAGLRVAVGSPADRARLEQDTVPLAGLVAGAAGVLRVVVTVNGVEVARREEPGAPRSLAIEAPLRLGEGANTVVVTATAADGTVHQDVRTVFHDKPVPLAVGLRYPEDGARVAEASSMVAAVVTSGRGVATVSVTVNGVEAHRQREERAPRSTALAVPVALREGTNTIVVTATEPDGAARQEVRTVVYERPRASPAPAGPGAPDRWAVVIGIGQYEHAEIPRLSYSVADAEAVHRALVGPGGFAPDHVLLLTDATDRKPTLRNLRGALGTFLARVAKKNDTVLIFFAGHGAPEVDPRGAEKDGLAKYLVPIDADPEDLFATALPMDDLPTIFARIEAERIVAFLDTCYSGAAGGRTFAAKRTRAGQPDDAFLERVARAKGRAIVTAARPAEVSLELAELGHGLFTYYLVQGLRGAADLNGDGVVALQELYAYVEREVTAKSRAVGGNQHPVMKGELEGTLPLVRVGGR